MKFIKELLGFCFYFLLGISLVPPLAQRQPAITEIVAGAELLEPLGSPPVNSTFGDTGTGYTSTQNLSNSIGGINGTVIDGNGFADNITVRLRWTGNNVSFQIKGALYDASNNLVGQTSTLTTKLFNAMSPQTLTFATRPAIQNNSVYRIAIWSNQSSIAGCLLSISLTGGTGRFSDSEVFGSWPNPLVPSWGEGTASAYCSYTIEPHVDINFVGHLGDSGGPYWLPPGETDLARPGYATNGSSHPENYLLINTTITNAESVYLHWLNQSSGVWSNASTFTNELGNYWTINYTTNISLGYNYSFDVYATDSLGGNVIQVWNKTLLGGGFGRRTVSLGCTTQNISSYQGPFYPFDTGNYSFTEDIQKYDRLRHDQATDGSINDTAYLLQTLPDDYLQTIYCTSYTQFWYDRDVSPQNFTLNNIYVHYYWTNDAPSSGIRTGWTKTNATPSIDVLSDFYLANVTNSVLDSPLIYDGDPYYLTSTCLNVTPTVFSHNNIYEFDFLMGTHAGSNPQILSNRSIPSFLLFNIPNNATLQALDSDGDGLTDFEELYFTYTNPFESDTDNDGADDEWENLTSTDPNNFSDFESPAPEWQMISNWNGSIQNTSIWHYLTTWTGSIGNLTKWTILQTFTGTILNTTIQSWNTNSTWTGTISNTSKWNTVSTWTGTITNLSKWKSITTWTGTITNLSKWKSITTWSGTITNLSKWKSITTWSGSLTNSTKWKIVSTWTGAITNRTGWGSLSTFTGSIRNTTNYKQISSWTGSIRNTSNWKLMVSWSGSLMNQTGWGSLSSWTGSIRNTTNQHIIDSWTGSLTNLTIESWKNIGTFTGSIVNITNWKTQTTLAGSISNRTSWILMSQITGSISNGTRWTNVVMWSGSIRNSSRWYQIASFTGSIKNITNNHTITDWSGSIKNTASATVWISIYAWSGTIQNVSTHSIEEWSGTIRSISSNGTNGSFSAGFHQGLCYALIFGSSVGVLMWFWNKKKRKEESSE